MTMLVGTFTRAATIALLAALAAVVTVLPSSATATASQAAATTLPPPAAPGADAPAHARVAACRRSPLIDERTAVVGASMRPLPEARRLALRIDLQQRPLGAGRWTSRSDVPGLGVWTSPSDPLVGTRPADVFKYRQAVDGLAVPFAYRFRVAFRWSDDLGAVVHETALLTRACRQPDLRPDLVLASVRAEPSGSDPALVRYLVVVRNDGRTVSGRAVVAATLPGDATPGAHLRSIGRIEPGGSALIAFGGPGCAAGEAPALFAVDPANAVEEVDEADNALAARCPAP